MTLTPLRIIINTVIKEKAMVKRLFLCLTAVVLFAGLLHAHGDPIMGTVTAVSSDSFTINDRSNKPVVIMLEKGTKYIKADKTVSKEDLKVGVRVIIDAHMDTKVKKYSAEEVIIGPSPTGGTK
jgi:hypothetical protein